MLFKSSAATPGSKCKNGVPITLKNAATTSNGVKFCNSHRASLVVDALNTVNYKVDDKTYLTI